ncbi:MAG: siphovirus Gp157 family protein [Gammaproteobacteria bacterium]
MALYQLAGSYRQLAEKLAAADFDAQTVADTIEASGLTDALQEKAQGVELVARAAEMHCPAIDAEIARLQALKAHRQKIAAGLREYIRSQMEVAGIERISCPLFELKLKKNPPAVEVLDERQVPAEYWVTPAPKPVEPRLHKEAVKAAIKGGKDVPGCRLVQATRLEVA